MGSPGVGGAGGCCAAADAATAKPEAGDYLAFLRTAAVKAIFEKYGFKFLVSPTT